MGVLSSYEMQSLRAMSMIALRSPFVRTRIDSVPRRRIATPMAHDRLLYWGSGSVYCWRAMIVLEEKELPYEGRLLEFSKSRIAHAISIPDNTL